MGTTLESIDVFGNKVKANKKVGKLCDLLTSI